MASYPDFRAVLHSEPDDRVKYLQGVLNTYLCRNDKLKCVLTIPCDATDSWILAAFEDGIADIEKIDSPWDTIIARKKDYHGIRIPGKNKAKRPYGLLIEKVCDRWDVVKEKCPQALRFETDIKRAIESFDTD